jgi:hypothetical protein
LNTSNLVGRPGGKKQQYIKNVKPIGYPNKAVVCYRTNCQNPGLVWLNEEDKANYDRGERDFVIWGHSVKIEVV